MPDRRQILKAGKAEIVAVIEASSVESESDRLEHARLVRAYRYAAANQLLILSHNIEPSMAAQVMESIDTEALDNLPHWCLMDDESLRVLQRVCAAVFLAPVLQKCIDGTYLKLWREQLGSSLFDTVLSENLVLQLAEAPPLPEASQSLMESIGASVLISTMSDHPAQPLAAQRTGDHNGLLDADLATNIYHAATALHQRLLDQSSVTDEGGDEERDAGGDDNAESAALQKNAANAEASTS